MSTNHVKIYLSKDKLLDHQDRTYIAGLNRKARRWGFNNIEQCWAVCDLNPDVDRIVTALYSGSAPAASPKIRVSRRKFLRKMFRTWGIKHTKQSLIQVYRQFQIVDSKRKGNLPIDK